MIVNDFLCICSMDAGHIAVIGPSTDAETASAFPSPLASIIISFASAQHTAQAADCFDYKKFSHKWNKCKLGKLKEIGSDEQKTSSALTEDSTKSEKKSGIFGGLLDGLKKIREFGGKKIGEAG